MVDLRDKRHLTTGDVATLCGVSFRTVTRWIQRGALSAFKLPGRGDHRIPRADLLHFLHDQAMPIPSELRPEELRVVVADRDGRRAEAVRRALEARGLVPLIVSSAFHAGIAAAASPPAALVVDLGLPGLGGESALTVLRGEASLSAVPVLALVENGDRAPSRGGRTVADVMLRSDAGAEEVAAAVVTVVS